MKYEEVIKQQDVLGTKAAKILWNRFQKLGIQISDSKNTQFGTRHVFLTLLEMSEGEEFARAAMKTLKRKGYRDSKRDGAPMRVPSSDWVLGKLADVNPKWMFAWCESSMRFMSRNALRSDIIQSNTMVGIDLTLNGYYGTVLKDKMLKTVPKNGTAYFDAYMTTHSIGPGYEIPLSNTRMTKDDKMDIILYENIKKIQRAGLKPSLYLVDKGFFGVASMLVLKNTGADYIMPAVKNPRIAEFVEQYHRGKIPATVEYTMSSKEFGSISFNLLIIRKDKYKESDPVIDQYVVFATSLPCSTKKELIKIIPKTYRQRWIIETAFRVIKDVKGKTCSNKLPIRVFLFYFALLLYCLWKCTKYYDSMNHFLAGGDDFTIAEFVESASYSAKDVLMWEKTQGDFF